MQKKHELAEKIHEICTYATLAQNEVNADKPDYHHYTQAFSALLRSQATEMDAENQQTIAEIVRTVFITYDDMTVSQEKLALYIENLVTQIQADPNYLQHWSLQSLIDAFVHSQDLISDSDSSYSDLDEFVSNMEEELDEAIRLYDQKSSASTEDNIQDSGLLDDDDDAGILDQEMEKILSLSTTAKQAAREEMGLYDKIRDTEPTLRNPSWEADNTSLTSHETESTSDNNSVDTPHSVSDLSQLSENEEKNTLILEAFSDKFHAIIGGFQLTKIENKDQGAVKTATLDVLNNLQRLYNAYFNPRNGITSDALAEFDNASQAIINHWSYSTDQTLSDNSTMLITQSFTKLKINLLKLTDEIRHDERLNPPSTSFER